MGPETQFGRKGSAFGQIIDRINFIRLFNEEPNNWCVWFSGDWYPENEVEIKTLQEWVNQTANDDKLRPKVEVAVERAGGTDKAGIVWPKRY